MTNYMQASIGRASFENDHFQESRKERTTYVFFAEIARTMKRNWLKKIRHPSCSSISDLIIILHDPNSYHRQLASLLVPSPESISCLLASMSFNLSTSHF